MLSKFEDYVAGDDEKGLQGQESDGQKIILATQQNPNELNTNSPGCTGLTERWKAFQPSRSLLLLPRVSVTRFCPKCPLIDMLF